jgi:hypothetical protein
MASILRFDNWQNSDGTSIATTDASGNISFAGAGAGKILQVVSAVKTDTQSASLGADVFADITDLNISLTCSSTSNKVLMVGSIAGGWSANNNDDFRWRFTAGGTAVGIGGAAGSRIPVTSFMYGQGAGIHTQTVMFLYSPSSTSAITYSVEFGHAGNGTYTAYVNRGIDYTDTRANHTYISTLTVMEVSA